jgi:hypothetical protein
MFSTSTILLRTAIVPRWIALLGYVLGAVLLLSIGIIVWVPLVFPVWVFLISAAILLQNLSGAARTTGEYSTEALRKELP